MVRQRQKRDANSLETSWENLKDKVKESIEKVVEAVGSYPIAPDDMGLIPVAEMVPAGMLRKRAAPAPRKRKATDRTGSGVRAASTRARPATKSKFERATVSARDDGARASAVRRVRKSA